MPHNRSRDVSVDYLRTTLTLLVIAHHSCLAYTTFGYFNVQKPFLSTAPVVDTARWVFFDYAENFNDVFFMSLMFFISGLFVYPALRRHGPLGFVRDRLLRLGVPFGFVVVVLMPVAFYASWSLSAHPESFLDFYKLLAAARFAAGPPWFIWLLLLFNIIAALLLPVFRHWHAFFERLLLWWGQQPLLCFLIMLGLSALVYLSLLQRYEASAWTVFITSPFAYQCSRLGLYTLWFGAGLAVGLPGFARGVLASDGRLARQWPWWLAGSVLAYNLLWFVPRLGLLQPLLPTVRTMAEALLWVASCTATCFGLLALFRGVSIRATTWMNSLSRSAYVMYLVHYVYVAWLQHFLLRWPGHPVLKFAIVFAAGTVLSWLTAQLLLRIPRINTII